MSMFSTTPSDSFDNRLFLHTMMTTTISMMRTSPLPPPAAAYVIMVLSTDELSWLCASTLASVLVGVFEIIVSDWVDAIV